MVCHPPRVHASEQMPSAHKERLERRCDAPGRAHGGDGGARKLAAGQRAERESNAVVADRYGRRVSVARRWRRRRHVCLHHPNDANAGCGAHELTDGAEAASTQNDGGLMKLFEPLCSACCKRASSSPTACNNVQNTLHSSVVQPRLLSDYHVYLVLIIILNDHCK